MQPSKTATPVILPSSSSKGSGKNDLLTIAAALAIVVLIVVILRSASELLIPITLSILVSFLLNPLVNRLHRWRVPRALAVVLVVSAVFSASFFLGRLMFSEMSALARELPRYSNTIHQRVDAVTTISEGGVIDRLEEVAGVIESARDANSDKASDTAAPTTDPNLDRDIDGDGKERNPPSSGDIGTAADASNRGVRENDAEPVPVIMKKDDSVVTRSLRWAAAPLGNFLAALGATVALTFFALLRHEQMRNRMLALAGIENITLVTRVFDEAGSRVSRYLLTQTLINGSYGILLATGLYFFGLPYAVLWGMLAFFFRFIPYVGPILVALLPITLSLIVFDDWTHPLGIIVFIALLELATNMIMEPIFYGHSVGMSDIAILVAVMFFTWLWGPVGMVIATPLTVCLVVFSKFTPKLTWVSTLVGADPGLPPCVAFYQRLVANDPKEAEIILRRHADETDAIVAIDEITLPALSLACREADQGLLSSEEVDSITAKIHQLSEQMLTTNAVSAPLEDNAETSTTDASATSASTDSHRALCIGRALEPGCDDIALQLFSRAGGLGPDHLNLSSQSLMSEWFERIESCSPSAVLLSTTAPKAFNTTELHVRHLHNRFPNLKIIVGRWGAAKDVTREKDLLTAGATVVFNDFQRTLAMLKQLRPGED